MFTYTGVEIIPDDTTELDCSNNHLATLPSLPSSLKMLDCYNNQLTTLPALPFSLKELWCGNNQLTILPALPFSLKELYCTYNQLTTLPSLPSSLEILVCHNNKLPIWYNSSPDEIRQEQQRRNKAALVIQKAWQNYWYAPNKEGISRFCQKSCLELNSYI